MTPELVVSQSPQFIPAAAQPGNIFRGLPNSHEKIILNDESHDEINRETNDGIKSEDEHEHSSNFIRDLKDVLSKYLNHQYTTLLSHQIKKRIANILKDYNPHKVFCFNFLKDSSLKSQCDNSEPTKDNSKMINTHEKILSLDDVINLKQIINDVLGDYISRRALQECFDVMNDHYPLAKIIARPGVQNSLIRRTLLHRQPTYHLPLESEDLRCLENSEKELLEKGSEEPSKS